MLGALVVIATVFVGGIWMQNTVNERSARDARLVNIAGRQRMLSQLVVRGVIAHEKAADRLRLRNALDQLERESKQLQLLINSTVSPRHGELAKVTTWLNDAAKARVILLTAGRDVLSENSDNTAAREHALASADDFLFRMEAAVAALQSFSEATVRDAVELAVLLVVAALSVMVLLCLTVVEPGVRLVRRQYLATAARNAELERLSMAVEQSTNAVIFTDLQHKITWVNDGFVRMTGYTADEAIGRTPQSLLSSARTNNTVVQELRDELDAGRGYHGVLVNRRKDGTDFWMDVDKRPMLNAEGAIIGFLGIHVDITEQVAQRDRLASIFDTVTEGVVLIGLDGTILESNPAADRILGLSSEEMRARKMVDARWGNIRIDGTPLLGNELPTAVTLRTGESQRNFVHGVRLPDDSRRWLSVNTVALRDACGEITAVVASFGDITDRLDLQSRTELVISGARLGTWDVHVPSGRATFNRHFAEMLGYSFEEIEPNVSSFEARLHPDERELVQSALSAHLEGRDSDYRAEHRLRRKDGSWAWVIDAGKVTERATSGEPIRMVGATIDISATKALEERAERAQKRYEAAVAGTSDGLWNWELGAETIWFSPRCWVLLGFPDRGPYPTITMAMFHDRLRPDDRARTVELLNRVITHNTPCDTDVQLRVLNEEYRHFRLRCNAQRDHDGRSISLGGSIQDIEAQKQSELKLLRATSQLEEAQAVARTGSWSFDLLTGTIEWSRQIFSLFGRDESAGEPDFAGVLFDYADADAEILQEAVGQTSRTGEPYSLVLRTRHGHGGTRFVRGIGRASTNAAGEIIGLFGMVTDVTTEIEREYALTQARIEIEGVNKRLVETNRGLEIATERANEMATQATIANYAKSEFLANMSHEIRTPLTAILGYSEMLRDELGPEPTGGASAGALDTIGRAGQHLLSVINDILDLSKIEAGKLEIERIETSLPQLLREVDSLMRARAADKGVILRTSLATPAPSRIYSDPTRFRQILVNLVGNAAKFTDHGSIEVRTFVAMAGDSSTLRIEIEDTGPGMTEAQARALFQPFSQADASVTRRHGGTGLGLTICRRLAGLMGGDVRLDYTGVGRGSRFVLELPLLPVADAELVQDLSIISDRDSERAAPDPLPTLAGRILLAEDGEDNQRLLLAILTKAGAQVTVAANGEIALQELTAANARGNPFQLLVTDIQMPVMDGHTLVRKLRAGGFTLPVIALTAHAMAEDRSKCLAAGCDEFATKPIDRRQLLSSCARLLHLDDNAVSIFPQAAIAERRAADNEATTHCNEILFSELADDPDMVELIGEFLEHLGGRVANIRSLRGAVTDEALRRLLHQLKGAAGGYGFMSITRAAHDAERLLQEDAAPQKIHAALDHLIERCEAAIRGRLIGESL